MSLGYFPSFDVPSGYPTSSIGLCLRRCLEEKGFCVLAASNWVDDDVPPNALSEVQTLRQSGAFSRPSSLIAPALLGDYGSARTARLVSSQVRGALSEAEGVLTSIFQELHGVSYGVTVQDPTMLHETGGLIGIEAELDEKSLEAWLQTLKTQRLMCLFFLGPDRGTLELQPFLEDDTDPFDVPTAPGTIVVLRSDLLLHTHQSIRTSFVMSSFFIEATQGWRQQVRMGQLNPTVKALEAVHLEIVRKMKEATEEGQVISKSLQRGMNGMFLGGEAYAIHGQACRLPSCIDPEVAFSAYCIGMDSVLEVPALRWDVLDYYDPDPESWMHNRSWTKHMSFNDGLELFDHKFFGTSAVDAERMDPQEKQCLEVGYEALQNAGLRKKHIMNSDTGYIVGSGNPEWPLTQCIFPGDLATMANRISYCLGMKGLSVCFDVDHAASLAAISIGTHELGKGCSQMLLSGAWFNFTHMFWPQHMQGHILSPLGRCCSFADGASGSVRSDGIGSIYVKKFVEKVDGEALKEETDMPLHGVIIGSKLANQGTSAGFTSPHGPALCSMISQVVTSSKISPLDVDIIECDAKGRLLDDAVEVASFAKVLRPLGEDSDEQLSMQCVKTSTGNSWYATGMQALLRNIAASRQGNIAPVVHLSSINRYCEDEATDSPLHFPTELLEVRAKDSIAGVMACGWGGTNCYVQTWGSAFSASAGKDIKASQRPRLCFWPGGGGLQESDEHDVIYTIVGSWSGWSRPETMHLEGDGTYGYTVTLGNAGWEQFHILVNGDSRKVLHPGQCQAPKSTAVYGPGEVDIYHCWMVDGRSVHCEPGHNSSAGEWDAAVEQGAKQDDSPDTGLPGARFRVRLQIVGKWRYVDWERL